MKKTKRYLALALILVLSCLLLAGCSGSKELKIELSNYLDYDIAELCISKSDAENWGDNILSEGDIFESGYTITILVEPPEATYFDFQLVDVDGDYFYFYDLPLARGTTVELMAAEYGYEAIVTPKKGDPVTIEGELELGESGEILAPTPDDPLDQTIAMPGFESLIIPYPSTMQVILSNDRFFQLDAINDPDNHNVILFDLIELGGSYEQRLGASDTSQAALLEIAQKVCDIQFPNQLVQNLGAEFYDGGSYYSVMYYAWFSGDVFAESSNVPVRGVIECRYYGPTGYILACVTLADEGVVRNYFDIAQNILGNVSFGNGWTTPQQGSTQWSDPGDQVEWYDGYDPWSDPGDYGYDWYDDEWYEPNDYDPWSDPGDGYDEWSDPGDYGYEDEYYEPNDYDF